MVAWEQKETGPNTPFKCMAPRNHFLPSAPSLNVSTTFYCLSWGPSLQHMGSTSQSPEALLFSSGSVDHCVSKQAANAGLLGDWPLLPCPSWPSTVLYLAVLAERLVGGKGGTMLSGL